MTEARNLNSLWAGLVVEELARNGVDFLCLSPGSRNTPLTLAVARNPKVRSVVHFDERGAAYLALGYAKVTGRPAALICTSGTAVANYLPAIVEASQSFVPLVVLTADRPPELQDAAANQTIDQRGIFGKYARWAFELPPPSEDIRPEMVVTTVDQAVYRALGTPAGPVHLNCAFREPLAPTASERDRAFWPETLRPWRAAEGPYTHYVAGERGLSPGQAAMLLERIRGAQRGLLIVGELRSAAERAGVLALAKRLGWPTLPEVTSGLRLGPMDAPFVPNYDQLLLSERFRSWCRPDVVLHVGGRFVSKRLQQHLEVARPDAYVVVVNHPCRQDPGHLVTQRVEAEVTSVCSCLTDSLGSGAGTGDGPKDWLDRFRRANEHVRQAIDNTLRGAGAITEPGVAQLVSRHAPEGSTLFLGNSMPIRDMDMYGTARQDWLSVVANRGASGIDGNVATAVGAATAAGRPLTAIIGDLALLHDLNSLVLLQKPETPVILVVINNDGGGVFHFLPIAEFEEVFEPYFGTPHGLTFEHAARMVGVAYACVDTEGDFEKAYQASLAGGRSALIEVTVDRKENAEFHRALQGAVVDALL